MPATVTALRQAGPPKWAGPVIAWATMPVESLTFRLSARGRPAGRLVLRSGERGRVTLSEARMQLQGALGNTTIVQTSRSHAARHHSLSWREEKEGQGDGRVFEVRFDPDSGLVTASRGRQNSASIPYLLPYRDPLSLLRELRAFAATEYRPDAPLRIPMLGKEVVVARVVETELEVAGQRRRAKGFLLHPGGSWVYVDAAAPHTLLKLVQRLDDQNLEALLVDVAEEQSMPGWEQSEPSESSSGRGGRRRRPRRRRSRGRG